MKRGPRGSSCRMIPAAAKSPWLRTTQGPRRMQPGSRADRRHRLQEVRVSELGSGGSAMDIVLLALTIVLAVVLPRSRALVGVVAVWTVCLAMVGWGPAH